MRFFKVEMLREYGQPRVLVSDRSHSNSSLGMSAEMQSEKSEEADF